MRFIFNITKKLSIRFFFSKYTAGFTFIEIAYDRFIDYKLNFTIFNTTLSFHYVNQKQHEALENLHENLHKFLSEEEERSNES